MITAVDTTVLLDVLGADPTFGPRSRLALDRCLDEGSLAICDVVWAETASAFPDTDSAGAAFATLGVAYSTTTRDAARAAGTAWRAYRLAGGQRTRVVADFLVGAHAATQADRLLTRDRGFHRGYFGGLTILDPTT